MRTGPPTRESGAGGDAAPRTTSDGGAATRGVGAIAAGGGDAGQDACSRAAARAGCERPRNIAHPRHATRVTAAALATNRRSRRR